LPTPTSKVPIGIERSQNCNLILLAQELTASPVGLAISGLSL
jgi:hypothetical protein